MKTYKIIGFIAAMVLTFAACETDVDDPAGVRGEGVVPAIVDLNPAVFDSNDMENTFIQFTLDDVAPATEAKLLVSYNGDKARAEVATYSSFPTVINLPLTEVVSKLNIALASVETGDVFNFEVTTSKGGKTYYSSASFNAAVVCAYNPDLVTGNYNAVSDSWGVDGNVTITADPDDEYKLYVTGLATIDGLDEDKGPLVMIVNPLNFAISVPKVVLASSTAPWGVAYTNIWYEGFGEVNTCNGTHTLYVTIGVDQGTFGGAPHTFVLTKL